MKREVELAKKLLESKGYEVSKKSKGRRLNENLSSKISNNGATYKTLKDFKDFVEKDPENIWVGDEYLEEERIILLGSMAQIESWLAVPADKIYVASDYTEAFSYLSNLMRSDDIKRVDYKIIRGTEAEDFELDLIETSEGDRFVSVGCQGFVEYYYL